MRTRVGDTDKDDTRVSTVDDQVRTDWVRQDKGELGELMRDGMSQGKSRMGLGEMVELR